MLADLRFLPAVTADAPELARVAARSFAEDVPLFGEVPPGMDREEYHARLIRDGRTVKLMIGEATVGGLVLFGEEGGSIRIHVVYVDPAWQDRGIGRQALAWIEAEYPEAACFELETPQVKARNLHLYLDAGYAPCGSRTVAAKAGLVLVRMCKRRPPKLRPSH